MERSGLLCITVNYFASTVNNVQECIFSNSALYSSYPVFDTSCTGLLWSNLFGAFPEDSLSYIEHVCLPHGQGNEYQAQNTCALNLAPIRSPILFFFSQFNVSFIICNILNVLGPNYFWKHSVLLSMSCQLQLAGLLSIPVFKFEAGYSLCRALAPWTCTSQ